MSSRFGPASDDGSGTQARTDGHVRVARHERRDEREQARQPCREIDVRVGDDVRVRAHPGGPQGAPSSLLRNVEDLDTRQLLGEAMSDCPRAVGRRVVGDDDAPVEREVLVEVGVEPVDGVRQDRRFVVHRHDDVDPRAVIHGATGVTQARGGRIRRRTAARPGASRACMNSRRGAPRRTFSATDRKATATDAIRT